MKLTENSLGLYELENDFLIDGSDVPPFVEMDLSDVIEAYNLIQKKLREKGVLAK